MKFLPLIFIFIFSDFAYGMGNRTQNASHPGASPASWVSRRFETANQSDLLAARNRYRAESCFLANGLQVSCGERSEWDNGDPSYDWDPYMSQIPRGTPVDVEIKCNPQTKKFYMNVKLNFRVCQRGANGQVDQSTCRTDPKYFNNPYNSRGGAMIQSAEPRWTATPGLYPDTPTTLPVNTRIRSDRAVITEYHRVSRNQPWAGAAMFHAVWVKGGIAIHGSDSNPGLASSGGCIRLSQSNAMAFYRLARRVGTRNIHYNFGGYGPGNPPACATPPDLRAQVLASREAQTQAERDQIIADLESTIQGQMAREGRVRGVPAGTQTEPARSVNSTDEKSKK